MQLLRNVRPLREALFEPDVQLSRDLTDAQPVSAPSGKTGKRQDGSLKPRRLPERGPDFERERRLRAIPQSVAVRSDDAERGTQPAAGSCRPLRGPRRVRSNHASNPSSRYRNLTRSGIERLRPAYANVTRRRLDGMLTACRRSTGHRLPPTASTCVRAGSCRASGAPGIGDGESAIQGKPESGRLRPRPRCDAASRPRARGARQRRGTRGGPRSLPGPRAAASRPTRTMWSAVAIQSMPRRSSAIPRIDPLRIGGTFRTGCSRPDLTTASPAAVPTHRLPAASSNSVLTSFEGSPSRTVKRAPRGPRQRRKAGRRAEPHRSVCCVGNRRHRVRREPLPGVIAREGPVLQPAGATVQRAGPYRAVARMVNHINTVLSQPIGVSEACRRQRIAFSADAGQPSALATDPYVPVVPRNRVDDVGRKAGLGDSRDHAVAEPIEAAGDRREPCLPRFTRRIPDRSSPDGSPSRIE